MFFLPILLLAVAPMAGLAVEPRPAPPQTGFEENRGQEPGDVRFVLRSAGRTTFVRPGGFTFSTSTDAARRAPITTRRQKSEPDLVTLSFQGSKTEAVVGEAPIEGRANILLGNDPSLWRRGIAMFGSVRLRNVWPGIDVVVSPQGPRYDFIVSSGADPRRIRLRVKGARRVSERNGSIQIETQSGGLIAQRPPVVYQVTGDSLNEVKGRAVLRGKDIQFEVGPYDRTKTLVIDPTIAFATYLGGAAGVSGFDRGNDTVQGLAVDPSGNSYVAGTTNSYLFPITPGTFVSPDAVGSHVFVAKFSPSGRLIYSTVIGGVTGFQGGRAFEEGLSVAADPEGQAIVGGYTTSPDFPSVNAFQLNSEDGPVYGFLLSMSPAGDSLVFSTLLHGVARDGLFGEEFTDDYVFGVAADPLGYIYATGITNTSNFPTGSGPGGGAGIVYKASTGLPNGEYSGWVGKFSPAGQRVYITYLGGVGETPLKIKADAQGRAFIAGEVFSSAYPVKNPAQPLPRGGRDVFLTILNPLGTDIDYSTFLGGNGIDNLDDILPVPGGIVYVVGTTRSTTFNVFNAAQPIDPDFIPGPNGTNKTDMFLARFDTSKAGPASLIYSTYLGGNGFEGAYALALDPVGRVMVLSETDATNFGPPGTGRRQALTTHGPNGGILLVESPSHSTAFFTQLVTNSFGDRYWAGGSGLGFAIVNPAQPLFGGGNFDAVVMRDCECDSVPLGAPSGRQRVSGNDWTFDYEVTPSEGVALHDVRLGPRYMAKKISVPYFDLTTPAGTFQHLALTSTASGGAGSTSLISLNIVMPVGEEGAPPPVGKYQPLVVEATYAVKDVSPQGKSCLRMRQRYEFFKPISEADAEDATLACEPSQVVPGILGVIPDLLGHGLPCGRLKPLLEYDYCPAEREATFEVNVASRFHFRADGDLQSGHLLARDNDTLSEILSSLPFSPITTPLGNPLNAEIAQQPVRLGVRVPGTVDNFHQKGRVGSGEKVTEPSARSPGCEECVHMHWRWGTHLGFPPATVPGGPLIPRGSTQTIDWGVVRFRAGEENPSADFRSLVDGEPILNADSVFWYGAKSSAGSDRFLGHGLFFSPKKAAHASNGSWAVLYPDDAEAGLTTFAPVPATGVGTLPLGYFAFQDPAVDIRAEGFTGTGPIIVAFGVAEVNDPDLFSRLRIFHREGTTQVDRTVLTGEFAPNFDGRTIYARVSSLSPFVLALGPVSGSVNRPPLALCQDVDRDADGVCMASVEPFDVDGGSSDPDGDFLIRTLSPASPFGLGDHGVSLGVFDPTGASATCQARVRVTDRTPPSIACSGPIVVGTDPGRCSAGPNIAAPMVEDNCGATLESTRSDGENLAARFLLGTTQIDWQAKDGSGLSSSCGQQVTVEDREPPTIGNLRADRAEIWPPSHKMVNVTVGYDVLDNCVAHVCALSVTSNEPQNGLGDGDTSPDWRIVDDHHVELRAERSGNGAGRVYTIGLTCTDRAGLASSLSTTVNVPKSRK